MGAINMRQDDPIRYAQQKIIKQIDTNEYNIKSIINEYFSDEMQTDETPMGALKRNQIVKQLLDFARA